MLEILEIINGVLGILFTMCYFFQLLYLIIPFIIKLPPHKETKLHKIAVISCGRNEEAVIGDLIDKIAAQDYPKELLTMIVVADNCTDNTAAVAREHGAIVYERFNKTLVGKGYALDFALKKLDEDFGEDAFDAFIVFDADNIPMPNYVTEINKTFSDGYRVVTSYRNSKNYGDGWRAAASGLWFLREAKYLNGSRMRIGACPQCTGTGFLFSNSIRKENGGWPFHTLTEDFEFTCNSVIKGEKFGYCEEAMFYDHQVSGLKQSWNQKLRWTKGGLQGFLIYWKSLLRGIFSKKFVACYDMLFSLAPAYILSLTACIINSVGAVALLATGEHPLFVFFYIGKMVLGAYLILLLQSFVTTLTEWRKIKANPFKKFIYIFTFPLYVFTFVPICFVALFKKVEWKEIRHTQNADSSQLISEPAEESEDKTNK